MSQLPCGCYVAAPPPDDAITICGTHGTKVRSVLTIVRPVPAQTVVHETGAVNDDGSQACTRCGKQILDAIPSHDGARIDRNFWGFAPGRRVAEGPTGFYLLTPDRQLAPGEVSCR